MGNMIKGQCFCGAVEFEVSGTPTVMGYCHCDDCSSWAAAPINAFSLWPRDSVKVTKGDENITSFSKTGTAHRKSCMTCGGNLFNDLPSIELTGVYPSVVPDLKHEPTMHVCYKEKTISIKDGLPKFSDFPTEFGGSGETLPE